jgi:C-terminal processing protease CtpA/Prc
VDWKKVHEDFAPRVAQTKSDEELTALLSEMLAELKTSHLEIVPANVVTKLKRPPLMVGMALKDIDGQVVIWRVWPNSSVSEAGLRTGFVIKTIDDTSVNKVEDALKKMSGEPHTELSVEYLNEHDELNTVTLERRLMPAAGLEKQLDEENASASEQFAAGLQEVGRAKVIGIKTAGEDMDADAKELPGGGFFVYPYGLPRTPKGVVIEGRGVIPDSAVPLRRSDLLLGRDSQLEAAIQYLEKK